MPKVAVPLDLVKYWSPDGHVTRSVGDHGVIAGDYALNPLGWEDSAVAFGDSCQIGYFCAQRRGRRTSAPRICAMARSAVGTKEIGPFQRRNQAHCAVVFL